MSDLVELRNAAAWLSGLEDARGPVIACHVLSAAAHIEALEARLDALVKASEPLRREFARIVWADASSHHGVVMDWIAPPGVCLSERRHLPVLMRPEVEAFCDTLALALKQAKDAP